MWIVGERTGTGLWARKTPAATKNKPRLIRHGALGQSAVADGVREAALWAQPRATAASGSRRAAGRRAKLGELTEGKSRAARIKPALLGGAPRGPQEMVGVPGQEGWRDLGDGGIWGMLGWAGARGNVPNPCTAERARPTLWGLTQQCWPGAQSHVSGRLKEIWINQNFYLFPIFPFKPFFYTVRKENEISGGFFPLQLRAANTSPLLRLPDRKAKLSQICACRGRQWLIFLS